MHLRLTCPDDLTERVVALLREEPGATSVTVARHGVLHPPADLVTADVAREAVDHVVDELERAGVARTGTITLQGLEVAVGEEVTRAERDAPGEGVDAVVWRELVERTRGEAQLSATFLLFLVAATLIAAMGLLTDSQVLIVGAMVLGPEFSALAGLAVAVVDRDARLARRCASALLVGFGAGIVAAALLVAVLRAAGAVPDAYLAGQRPLTSFVASPDVFSILVALVAGVAGTVSLTASRSSALVGVFISVTTVPAAAEIAAASVTGQLDKAAGSVVQLGVNVVCIVGAAAVTLLVQRAAWRHVRR